MANAIKSIAKYIERNPDTEESAVLRDLCAALEQEGAVFEIQRLFDMKSKAFDLALALLDEWRFDRHVASRRLEKYLGQGGD
ncbi:MAG: hypothetical protein PHS77_11450 [Gallionellaceae bacterium]|nr:hypothetical protein [Gallionellaceae bacterium]